jgi:hypothetical protein
MKKTVFILSCILLSVATMAQSDKYIGTMQTNITLLDTTKNVTTLTNLAGTFERIANAEKTQWLPYYYSALADINIAYAYFSDPSVTNKTEKIDPLADKAEALINKADELSKDNSEIYVMKRMIASMRMMADPMSRYMTYGPIAAQALATAKKLDPENPRVYILEAEDKYFTPEQYGGSKAEAKTLFETALKKLDTFKPQSDISPQWGRSEANYFLGQMK